MTAVAYEVEPLVRVGQEWATLPKGLPRQETSAIRLLLVDDHTLFRQGLASLLKSRGGMEVVGQAGDGIEAVRLARQLQPDVVLMDISMPGMNGVDATREITRSLPGVRVLVLGTPSYTDQLMPILRAGAAGYLLKEADADELFRGIAAVHNGNSYFSPEVSTRLVQSMFVVGRSRLQPVHQPLTAREREILDLVAEGHPNQEIARRACVSVKTVEAHKANIIAKLGLKGAIDLVRYAVRKQMSELEA
ncbi:MAG: response regulator transcription factor [Dehalococcoidales bacterium]|nr:response regulator transcription factor [Dehalococcoidales bacterium]